MTTSSASDGICSGSIPTGLGVAEVGEATPGLTFEKAAPVTETRSWVAIGVTVQSAGWSTRQPSGSTHVSVRVSVTNLSPPVGLLGAARRGAGLNACQANTAASAKTANAVTAATIRVERFGNGGRSERVGPCSARR
jgi:hypothetical protein